MPDACCASLILEKENRHYVVDAKEIAWREWDGLYAIFDRHDQSTHLIDPLSSLVFDCIRSADAPRSFDNLVSSVLDECGEDVDVDAIVSQLEDRLPEMLRIGLIAAVPAREYSE